MKKTLLLLTMLAGSFSAYADDTAYGYLTFELTDGTKASVSVTSLSMTISGTTLTAGDKTFEVENLSKMYFTASDEGTTGIGLPTATPDLTDESAEIYDLQGHKVSKDQLHRGIYIIKTKQGTHKIVLK